MRVFMGDHLPLTARFVLIKEGIDHTTQADSAWSSKVFSHSNIWSNKLPFSVIHITRIVGCVQTVRFHIFSLANISLTPQSMDHRATIYGHDQVPTLHRLLVLNV